VKGMRGKPPRLAEWLLIRFSSRVEKYSLVDDLREEYEIVTSEHSRIASILWYWWQVTRVLLSLSAHLLRWRMVMLKNYYTIALRNLKKHKGFSTINIAGLSTGMAACILILLWVQDELSFDRFHVNAHDLYRVVLEEQYANRVGYWPVISIPVGPALKANFPEIEDAARFRMYFALIQQGNRRFDERGGFVDPSFFDLFTFPFVKGDRKTAFPDPYSIVITERTAEKYFGHEDPLGRILKINNETDYRVTGVIQNVPRNSHLRFDFLMPFDRYIQIDRAPESWGRNQIDTYVLLQGNTSIEEVNQKIAGLLRPHLTRVETRLFLQPLTRIHLYNLTGGGNIRYVYIFSIIAAFVLLIACINFMNLTTARSSTRIKEVGMRKVTGAQKSHLVKQFIGESILLSFISLFFSIILVSVFLPTFNSLSGKQLTIDISSQMHVILGIVGLAIFTGLISGSYPALILSSLRPVHILRGSLLPGSLGTKRSIFRKVLVVIQFSISIVLIICSVVVSRQLDFIKNRDLGYNKEQVVFLSMNEAMNRRYDSIKNALLKDSNVSYVTGSSMLPTEIATSYVGFDWEGKEPDQSVQMYLARVHYEFIETLDIKLIQGRSFSKDYPTDGRNFILNESAVKLTGLRSPVGSRFSWGDEEGTIIGVVEDFHFRSLHEQIGPLILVFRPERCGYICIQIKSNAVDLSGTINQMETTWNQLVPEFPFEYHFLDEDFDAMYRSEQRIGRIFRYFTFLAVFVSCLGLFGLAAFIAERRTKEIGIRKVLGASVTRIVKLLVKEFVILVSLANIFA